MCRKICLWLALHSPATRVPCRDRSVGSPLVKEQRVGFVAPPNFQAMSLAALPVFEFVFAVGDVRANSIKRVASAVGEGSICIQLVHKVLAEG